ncbi:guanylate kinase [Sulfidibacter corallicola]|uniref:Guanylate kinase n=1 Tax=Sulfidibacter corallicola TaxID=2818388 RepID=A0A8A4TXW5_SULCO|nr:guanylate kinase [Sulfidibacter corallicola]QTD54048.1 guanylate kinase [Sulfidibacter corallicola]
MEAYKYSGNIVIVIGPSGAGKSTLLKRLIAEDDRLVFSVSHTTRPPRAGEVDGKHYFFTDRDHFQRMIDEEAFLEWAEVHANCYGTSKAHIEEQLSQGLDVLLDIDVQGALQIKRQLPSAIAIFIAPPSYDELQRRLENRGEDSPEVIQRRLNNARSEMTQMERFDYLIVNDNLERCYTELRSLVAADRFRVYRRQETARLLLEKFKS